MFSIVGLKANILNIVSLVRPFLQGENRDAMSLKQGYRRFLRQSQPRIPHHDVLPIGFFYQYEDINELMRIFGEPSTLDDFVGLFDPLANTCMFESSIEQIKAATIQLRNLNRDFYDLMNLVINTVFTAPSKLAGGGSTSEAIGCIWANPRPKWCDLDLVEFLIHETTHNLVFLDELCWGHYTDYDALPKKENYALSAILKTKRPLDKVFHSIIVSSEVLLFRERDLGHPSNPRLHPPSEILLKQTLESIHSVLYSSEIANLITERATRLLQVCEEQLQVLSSKFSSLIPVGR